MKNNLYLLAGILLLCCSACQKNDVYPDNRYTPPSYNPELKINNSRFYFLGDDSLAQQLKISANTSWTISGSGSNWLILSTKKGTSSTVININAPKNEDSLPRYEQLVLSAPNTTIPPITINVCQGGMTERDISGNFPDAIFRQYCIEKYGNHGILTPSQASFFNGHMNINNKNIHSLAGIEYFTSLTGLICSGNPLFNIDVSRNPLLMLLFCDDISAPALDVSNNLALVSLSCSNNKLSTLDLSKHTHLQTLDCSYNLLSSLDIKNNTELTSLSCNYNQLASLNLPAQQPYLRQLICDNNRLTVLDVSRSTCLSQLNCSNNKLTNLSITKNKRLEKFDARWNNMFTIYVWSGFDVNNPPEYFHKDNITRYQIN